MVEAIHRWLSSSPGLTLLSKREERQTRAVTPTPTKGHNEQHPADAPFRERGPSTATLCKSLAAQVGRFGVSRILTHARHLRIVIEADAQPRIGTRFL